MYRNIYIAYFLRQGFSFSLRLLGKMFSFLYKKQFLLPAQSRCAGVRAMAEKDARTRAHAF
jgi:hypothetical protein